MLTYSKYMILIDPQTGLIWVQDIMTGIVPLITHDMQEARRFLKKVDSEPMLA